MTIKDVGGYIDLSTLVDIKDFEVKRLAEHDGEQIWIRPLPSRSFALCLSVDAAKALNEKLTLLLGEPVRA